jgi:hypothetical protein
MWSAWHGPGLGHLRLAARESGVVADGLVLGVSDGHPFRLSYEVRCDPYWRVRAARVGVPGEPRVELLSDGGGTYRFVSLDGGFTADLPVDLDGLVVDYPGLFRRVFA